MRIIDAYRAIDMIDEWLDSVGTVLVGKGLSSYGELIGCIEDTPALTPPNEPLTLEVFRHPQLCQMVGKTVNVIRMGELITSERATVFALGDCKTDSGCLCYHELYGKTWIAYRLPAEMEDNRNG